MSVWLSTTMRQALRNLVDLYTFYFETLERFLDGLLDLLCVCICQGIVVWALLWNFDAHPPHRERYVGSNWYFMSPAAAREERQEA